MKRALHLSALLVLLVGALLAPAALRAQDVDPPVIAILESGAPLADGALFNRVVTPTIEVTDASPVTVDSLLDGAVFTSGTAVSGEGSHELAVTATDDAGNSSSLTVGFEIDTVAPVFGAVTPADGTLTAAAQVTLQGQVTGAATLTVDGQAVALVGDSFSAGPFTLAEGPNAWTLVATDAAGNGAQLAFSLVRDSTAPTVAIGQPPAGAVLSASPVDVVGSVSDAHLASVTVNGTAAQVTGSTFLAQGVPLGEGSTQLVAETLDEAGNSAQATRTAVLDTQPPAVAITDPAPGTVVPGASILVSGTASDPHLDRVEVGGVTAQLAAGAWSVTVPLTEGANTLTATAVDTLGWSAADSVSVVRDSQAPEIHVDTPAEGAYLQGDTVDVSGTVGDEAGITVTVNGQAATLDTSTTPDTFTATLVPLVEGENRLIARVTDGVGNQGAHTRIVYRDSVAPTFVASDPGDGALAVPPETVFDLTFSEPLGTLTAGAWRLELAGGQALGAADTASGETLQVVPDAPLPSKAEVHLVLTTGIVDRAGNGLAEERTLTFTVRDIEAPAPPVLSAQPPGYLCASQVTLSGTAEAGSIVAVSGGAATASVRAEDGTFTLVAELLPAGINHLELTATDQDGNRSEPLVVEVVQDCTAPEVVSAQLAGDAVSVTFDEPVDGASATAPGVVTLSGASGPIAGTAALEASGDVVTFTATDPLPAEVLRLDVSQGVHDLAGNTLAYPYSRIFGAGVTDSFLSGRVLDAATGRPLAGVTVVVDSTDGVVNPDPQPQQTTGPDGRFRIPVPAGTHALYVVRPGYTPALRIVASASGLGADVFDPRLTPEVPAETVSTAGGTVAPESETGAGPTLNVPTGALAADTLVTLTALDEQALPSLLPFGWSPRGAVWLDLAGTTLAAPATLSLPVDAPDGSQLALVRLDLATLQWHVEAVAQVVAGAVTLDLTAEGAYAAVEADTGSLAPPAPVAGTVLGSSAAPAGDEVTAAALSFDPSTVLPSQRSRVTASYTLSGEAPSGLPLTVSVREELTLLDGTVRQEAPYEADLVLYHGTDGAPRSLFDLRPSPLAQDLPLEMGAEDVTVHPYAGETVQGNVLGPAGGTVSTPEGDRVDLPAGAVTEPTAVLLERGAEADLPAPVPAGAEFLGLLTLDLSGRTLAAPAALTLELGAAPSAGQTGALFEVIDTGASGTLFRPVAALAATATGWTTAAIDPQDLPWPGVREGGSYLFARWTSPVGYLRGTVFGLDGLAFPGALVSAGTTTDAVPWVQISADAGSYVLPVPVDDLTVLARDPATGNEGAGAATVPAADDRVDLDLFLQLTGPEVVEVNPADGTQDVTPGIEPTVRFTEAVDPTTTTTGVLLYTGSDPVPVTQEVQGALVRLKPLATLVPGATYEIRVNTAVRDLQGNRLTGALTTTFTTLEITLSETFDLTRIHLFEPDSGGMSRVLGRPGAVPAGSLVFVENLSRLISTPSVTADSGGGFDFEVEASLTDRLLLHVLVTGQNEVVVELTPFLTADGQGGYVGTEGSTFTTVDGLTVHVEAGTFAEPTVVRAEPEPLDPSPVPAPEGVLELSAFRLDFGGAEAAKPVQVTIDAPAATPDIPDGSPERLMLLRAQSFLGDPFWMLYDFLRQDGARLTTEAPPATAAASRVAPRAQEGSLPGERLQSQPVPTTLADQKEYLPGILYPGDYRVTFTNGGYDFLSIPMDIGLSGFFVATDTAYLAVIVDGAIQRVLRATGLLLPIRRGHPVHLVARDLTTGYRLLDVTLDPPAQGSVLFAPPGLFDDSKPPYPVSGSPLRFFVLEPGANGDQSLEPGIAYEVLDSESPDPQANEATLRLHGDLGASQADVQLRLVGFDDDVDQATRTHAATTTDPGVFDQKIEITRGNRYVLAVGAVVPVEAVLRIGFSEGLDPSFFGIDVQDAAQHSLSPEIEEAGSARAVAITPQVPWSAGTTYTLVLGPTLADGSGTQWDKSLKIEFRTEASRRLGSIQLAHVRDVARLGSWLFVAADTQGLAVLDASDPANLQSVVRRATGQMVTFPFPLGDPARGVAVDPHGRVVAIGGGVDGYGVIRIFDPLALNQDAINHLAADPTNPDLLAAPFKGIAVLSNPLGSGAGAGTPERVTVVSDDQTDRWVIGVDPAPAGVTVSPEVPPPGGAEYDVTITGAGWIPDAAHFERLHPITLRDLTRGRWMRSDTDASGNYSVTLKVVAGDVVELLRNKRSLAYVATRGIGLQVVDLDAFYHQDHLDPAWTSDLVGEYTGDGDASLRACDAPVSDIGGAILDLGALLDPTQTAHPLTLVSLLAFKGLTFFDDSLTNAGQLTFFHDLCLNRNGSAWVSGLAVLEHYPFDMDGDGIYEKTEYHDYLLVAHRREGLLIVDVEDRDLPSVVGQVKVPGEAVALGVDRDHRRVYVAGAGGGIYVVDLDRPPQAHPIDTNGDGLDDRVLEKIELKDPDGTGGTASSPILLVPELGVAFAGTTDNGLHSVQVGGPELYAVAETSTETGAVWRQISRLAPFGVPTAPESSESGAEDLPGSFHVLAHLPASLGDTVTLDVASLGPGGGAIAGAGDPAAIQDLPPTALDGTEALVLHRLADSPLDDGYQTYLSGEVAVLADLRAATGYTRTVPENGACTRCDAPAGAHEILSGDAVAVRFSSATRDALEPIFGQVRLDAAELEIPSVRWETSPSLRQEPTLNPSLGSGDVAPGTLLASGELTQEATDLVVKARGFDFAFTRTYRSQTVGAGPLGPGWDFGYDQRLRELPDGDVEYYDGRGRRETFTENDRPRGRLHGASRPLRLPLEDLDRLGLDRSPTRARCASTASGAWRRWPTRSRTRRPTATRCASATTWPGISPPSPTPWAGPTRWSTTPTGA